MSDRLSFAEAREELTFHCGAGPVGDSRWEQGFLQTLRPYRGLRRDVMQHVEECIDAVEPYLRTASSFDRQLISSLWAIVNLARTCALEPGGELQRNGLITDEDASALDAWLRGLGFRIALALDGPADA